MKHKDHYNDDYILDLSKRIRFVMPDFDEEAFSHALIGQLDDKELFCGLILSWMLWKKYAGRLLKKY